MKTRITSGLSHRSCYFLESGITCLPHALVFCCDRPSPASICPSEDVVETVDRFLAEKERIIKANQTEAPPCEGCPQFLEYKPSDGKIKFLNLATHCYCQFSCIYCELQKWDANNKNKSEDYDCLEIAKELKRRGLLSEQLDIGCAPGEISIHPNRDAFYDFIEENAYSVTFSTNAGVFDERLAQILRTNSRSGIIVSLDCGTRETFRAVRGVDMFDAVVTNLKRYREYSPDIRLKYILLPENSAEEDLDGFIRICKDLDVSRVIVSADRVHTWDYHKVSPAKDFIVNGAFRLCKGAIEQQLQVTLNDYELGDSNLTVLLPQILETPQVASAESRLDEILTSQRVIWYGAGRNAKYFLPKLKDAGLRMPDVIWDKGAGSQGGFFVGGGGTLDCPIDRPAFETLDPKRDAVIISIENAAANREVIQAMREYDFSRFVLYYDFNLAFMAKRLRQSVLA